MSVNVYLKQYLMDLPGFPHPLVGDSRTFSFSGLAFSQHGDGFLLHATLDTQLPAFLQGYIERITARETFPTDSVRRTVGVYRYKDAEATVDRGAQNAGSIMDRTSYTILIEGPNLEQIRELFLRIRAGTIVPATSWEDHQVTFPELQVQELANDVIGAMRTEGQVDLSFTMEHMVRVLIHAAAELSLSK